MQKRLKLDPRLPPNGSENGIADGHEADAGGDRLADAELEVGLTLGDADVGSLCLLISAESRGILKTNLIRHK